jgi:hypothetical protein
LSLEVFAGLGLYQKYRILLEEVEGSAMSVGCDSVSPAAVMVGWKELQIRKFKVNDGGE